MNHFLQEAEISEAEAARITGIGKATLNTYTHDDTEGKRMKPNAEAMFRLCADLGFKFEYKGYQIMASRILTPSGSIPQRRPPQTEFSRQFNLTEDEGRLSVRLKRQADRVEFSVSLKAVS